MQASHHNLRTLVAVGLLAGLAAGCQLTGAERPVPAALAVERAESAAMQGEHAAAARHYEVAVRSAGPGERNRLWLAAAGQWLLARDLIATDAALAELAGELSGPERVERTRLAAELALARGSGAPPVALLEQLPEGADAATQATRARILFRAGRVAEAIRALIARERLVTGSAALLANRRMILDGIGEAERGGADLRPPKESDALLAGWIELGRIVSDAGAGGLGIQRRLQAWRARYPAHPATEELWRDRLERRGGSRVQSGRVALLLPLSGRAGAAGAAVRDGFLGAYYDQDTAARPLLRVYDVADGDVATAYQQALADGSDFIVGPLTRDEVAAVAAVADGRASVLALNFLPEGTRVPGRFYQFALSPEDEARQVARRVLADGRPDGVALVPDSDWGRRTLAAFSAELAALGGRLVGEAGYAPDTMDFNATLRQLLQTSGQRGSVPRPDASFIFVLAQPLAGRLIRSQLRYNYAAGLPVYATSDIFEPAGAANLDLDGVQFPAMPWILDDDGPYAAAREAAARALGNRQGGPGRLYAFGYDAYRIIMDLNRLQGRELTALPGLTGRLGIDSDGRVRRELRWAQISEGRLAPLP
jgi:outer membrane PBP1 activator LpoA protein